MSVKVPEAMASPPGSRDLDEFYIRTDSSPADEHSLVLKQGETFVVLDRYGEIVPVGLGEEGLYHEGTRYLSRLSVRIGGQRGLLLSSGVKQHNDLIAVDLTNLDLAEDDVTIPRGTLHVSRIIVLWDAVLHERLQIRNYGRSVISTSLVVSFDADYADIFEVRGTHRRRRGEELPTVVDGGAVLGYRGLDGVTRRTRIAAGPLPVVFGKTAARLQVELPPQGKAVVDLTFGCEIQGRRPALIGFSTASSAISDAFGARRAGSCQIVSSNDRFNEWFARGLGDLAMMVTDTPSGAIPYAGVPWFNAPFGRDSIITALECLWACPDVARGVLSYLAATQATSIDAARDAQPGKILHEARKGEMAALDEIPFGRYYGSHDATPLFVMLAEAYYERTGDRAFIEQLWPHIEAALRWIETDGDPDGDGFVEYERQATTGLVNQGWKDSHDAIFHADGTLAEGPIALCEIQGYVHSAWQGAARLAGLLGHSAVAASLVAKAERLRQAFDAAFWSDELGSYALALDGAKRRCDVVASNAGHALYTGIATPVRARAVARTLLAPQSYSGWGIRTVASTESRYNPMSYHNGSVWPHDNALIAAGFSRYGLRDEVRVVMDGLFSASADMDLHRLPELFCGFRRRSGEAPVLYPVACSPQSWASASVFLLLQAVLGLEICGTEKRVRFTRAQLPEFLDCLRIHGLRVGSATVDLELERHTDEAGIRVLRRDGQVEVVSVR